MDDVIGSSFTAEQKAGEAIPSNHEMIIQCGINDTTLDERLVFVALIQLIYIHMFILL